MIKRIDLFVPTSSQYGALHHFTQQLYEAFLRCGVHSRLLAMDERNPAPFLKQLFDDPPDCTLAFNGVLPDREGRFLCDLIKVPHAACLVDSPLRFLPLIDSPYNVITCIDQNACDVFRGAQFEQVLFMPLAVEKSITFQPDGKRLYDVLLLASYIDYEEIARTWNKNYPPKVCRALLQAAEITLANSSTPYGKALVECLPPQLSAGLDPGELVNSYEAYIRGLERVRLVQSIRNARIDIFGTGHTQAIWDRHLGKRRNVVVHNGVPFIESLELMKHAKIVLNSCAWIQNGAHDRVFSGSACGAAVLTGETRYLKSFYVDGDSILYFRGNALEAIDSAVLALLKDEPKRQALAAKGREITLKHHTWDQRAAFLLDKLTPLLKSKK